MWQVKATYINTNNSQMVYIGAIFTSTYHAKQLNSWPNSSASRVVNYSQLSAFQGERKPFNDNLSTHGWLTSLRNKPQQKQLGQPLVPISAPSVSQYVQLSYDGEKCVLLLCVCVCGRQIFSNLVTYSYKALPCNQQQWPAFKIITQF